MIEDETRVVESDNNPGWVDGSISSGRVDNVSVTFIKRLSSSLCIWVGSLGMYRVLEISYRCL